MSDKKIALFGDIHSNLEALTAVLEDAEANGVTNYICVGDIVGYNADPSECLERVRELCDAVVRGNHDHYCSHDECLDDFHPLAAKVVDWTRRQLTEDQVRYLRKLRMQVLIDGVTVVHSTLDMPEKWGYVLDTLEADANFAYQSTALCFHGHTHVPVVFERHNGVIRRDVDKLEVMLGRKYFVNTGSVGQPRDGDPRASYVIYTPGERSVEFRRLDYDIETAQQKIRDAGLPERLALRLAEGR